MTGWTELEAALAQRVGGERLAHVYRVLETARELAPRFGADLAQAEMAALMHDYCRTMPVGQLLEEARRRNLLVDPAEETQPILLHGPVAAALLQEQGLVTEPAVLEAIRWHTTGRVGMGLLEKVIWLADYIEPDRRFPGVEEIRETARQNLNGALLMAMDTTMLFVIRSGWPMHLYTVQARNWLLSQAKRS